MERLGRTVLAVLIGAVIGLLALIIHKSNAFSYLSDSTSACINCHVMYPQYASWQNDIHSRHASCNACHVPHRSVFSKYWFKLKDGMRHAAVFTLRKEPQVIRTKRAGIAVLQENCITCHSNTVHPVSLRSLEAADASAEKTKNCWDCHRLTPHGRNRSLSSAPAFRPPDPKNHIPEWLNRLVTEAESSSGGEK